jgi:hypothetical protein
MKKSTILPYLCLVLFSFQPVAAWEFISKDETKILVTPNDELVKSLSCVLWPELASHDEIMQPGGRLSYADKHAILSISDGDLTTSTINSLLVRYKSHLHGVTLTRTYGPSELPGKFPNEIKTMKVDNEQRLPFRENEFDAIVLRNGICECAGRAKATDTCAGIKIDATGNGFSNFLTDLTSTLNKTKRNNFIFIHGNPEGMIDTSRDEKLWLKACLGIKSAHSGLDVKMVYVLRRDFVKFDLALRNQAFFNTLATNLDKNLPVPSAQGHFTLMGILVEVR